MFYRRHRTWIPAPAVDDGKPVVTWREIAIIGWALVTVLFFRN